MKGFFFFLHSLYYFSNDSQVSRGFQASFKSSYEPFLWHCPLAHPSDFVFSKINSIPTKEPFKYEICHFPKSSKLPFNPFISHDTHAFGLVHSYVWRLFYTSLDGFKYSVTFIDDFSRVTWVYCWKLRVKYLSILRIFIYWLQISSQFILKSSD